MKRFRMTIACVLVGVVTAMAGFPILSEGNFSIKNLLIVICCCGIVTLVLEKDL